jgi:hypothetical protein
VGTPRALRHREGLREVQGSVANTTMGTIPAHGRWRVAVHGSAVAQFYSGEQLRTIEGKQGKIGAGVDWLPQGKAPGPLNGGGSTTRPRVDGGGAAAARREGPVSVD